ncbi:hypothetical protein, partial [Staphylococcus epidermidis]|uniref:hypothetical protein n=1 Tax=Staphylococcus epidermidis TaxID=1282 RepID=UPI001C93012C
NEDQYLFDSLELHPIQTYLPGKPKHPNNLQISPHYHLLKTLTHNVFQSLYSFKHKRLHFHPSFLHIPLPPLSPPPHKPIKPQPLHYIQN